MRETVAVVGAGAMGAPVARRLHKAGYRLLVCDVDERARASFAREGIRVTARAADCAVSDVIMIFVATPAQMRTVLNGDDGIIHAVQGRTAPTVVVMSTVGPHAVLAAQQQLLQFGVPLVDLPASGGPIRARNGTLTLIAGGEESRLALLRPLLETIGDHVFYCGPVGTAQTVKVLNNLVCAANVAISGEVFRLAGANGVPLSTLLPVLDSSTGHNFLTGNSDAAVTKFGSWTTDRTAYDSILSILRKDINLADELIPADSALAYPAWQGLRSVFNTLGDETWGHWREIVRSADIGGISTTT